ncbi:uncharacterized protein METZ01_LOCUS383981, partial [marine metagenome]
VKLNCDLGEEVGSEEAVMPFIDQANIACGFHAGSPELMRETLVLARIHGVSVGAHPGYADREGFGRRSMHCKSDEIFELVLEQIAVLDELAKVEGITVDYVKPHGALYHDLIENAEVRAAIFLAVAKHPASLTVVIQATPEIESHRVEASIAGLELWAEAFADRRYNSTGGLLPRQEAGAMLDQSQVLAQVRKLLTEGSVITDAGKNLAVSADTLCVHGDHAEGVEGILEIRKLLSNG